MSWTVILQGSVPVALAGFGWLVRRGLIKYERALVSVEKLRREMAEKELGRVSEAVQDVTRAVARVTQDHEAMKKFLGDWAHRFTGEVGNLLKLSQKDVDELKGVLGEMSGFLTASKDTQESAVKQIAKDVFLVHKPKPKE